MRIVKAQNASLHLWRICAWVFATASVAGCDDSDGDRQLDHPDRIGFSQGGDDASRLELAPMPDDLPGVYGGEFPCPICDGIAATLWLRQDYRFFLKQTYLGGEPRARDPLEITQTRAYTLGRWRWDEQAAQIVLEAPGQPRLSRIDEQSLKLLSASPAEHLLTRDAAAPPFSDRVRLDGESAIVDGNGVFKECLTGLSVPIVKNSAFSALRKQHRILNAHDQITRTEIEGRFILVNLNDVITEMLVVDHVVKLLPGTGCEPDVPGAPKPPASDLQTSSH
jgi:hypothetical protein